MATKQELSPLLPEEIERLRAEYDRLPMHDPRRGLLATLDQARMEMDVLRRLVREDEAMIRELRAGIDSAVRTR